jgi:hypothetical protein
LQGIADEIDNSRGSLFRYPLQILILANLTHALFRTPNCSSAVVGLPHGAQEMRRNRHRIPFFGVSGAHAMILYVGPDQLIPLSGVFGTVLGLLLIFWNKLMQGLRKLGSVFSSRAGSDSKAVE